MFLGYTNNQKACQCMNNAWNMFFHWHVISQKLFIACDKPTSAQVHTEKTIKADNLARSVWRIGSSYAIELSYVINSDKTLIKRDHILPIQNFMLHNVTQVIWNLPVILVILLDDGLDLAFANQYKPVQMMYACKTPWCWVRFTESQNYHGDYIHQHLLAICYP